MDNQNHVDYPTTTKEWKLIEKVVTGLQDEQRKTRRWGIFFKLIMLAYVIAIFVVLKSPMGGAGHTGDQPYAAVIEVNGVIAAAQEASADNIISALRDAFEDEQVLGVILRINSPGGSPVQSGYVYDEIKRLKATRELPVYAVISDLGASGAYYIAAAADEIYADKASLVGSIGVVGSGFGFTGVMEKLGVERRLYTSGEHKGFLDPFSPENPEEKQFWQGVLKVTHDQFIEQVRLGRGDRLKETPEMFSGLIWSGEQALEMGLIDGLSSTSALVRTKFNSEEMVNFTRQPDPWESLVQKFGMSVGAGLATVVTAPSLQLH
ncbi:Periplasmic serine protease (ClpP class) [Oleispira antarctica RB-8]|uniref:Periplasmic serine protease (ClpP class) n=1 Tax=Oleispira antarctica RB-8 TaxID=698738 RepID=R4YSC7_OLEAN|nr:Periplasmic serine protease (ClpP class) [Oleispira antarctica RB-8]